MNDLELLVDLHRDGPRQGPGDASDTRLAVALSGLGGMKDLRIADLGCGTGASTLVLARELDADIIAVDVVEEFLVTLEVRAEQEGLSGRIATLAASMDALPFEESSFDAIWSEGAIYNVGFANGIETLRRFLKPGGIVAVSELTWLTQERPAELQQHWMQEYPEVDTASAKMAVLEKGGFAPIGYFALAERSWLDGYYRPLQLRFGDFLSRHPGNESARAIVEGEQKEIDLYERHSAFVSYGYYLARKTRD